MLNTPIMSSSTEIKAVIERLMLKYVDTGSCLVRVFSIFLCDSGLREQENTQDI